MTLNRNGVRACINNTNEQEAVYLKGMHSFCSFDEILVIGFTHIKYTLKNAYLCPGKC